MFSVEPLVLRVSTLSDRSVSLMVSASAPPYSGKPPPGVAVPNTILVVTCRSILLEVAMMSSLSSSPIESRTTSGPAPACTFCASDNCLCVVEAG